MRIAADDVLRAGSDQVWTNLAGEIAILDISGGQYYGLDGVGARVWALLQEARTFADLCAHISAEYDVDPTRCELDLAELIDTLVAQRLVQVVADNAG